VKTAVLNADDPNIKDIPGQCSVVTFGLNQEADVRADNIVHEEAGLSFTVYLKEGGSSDIRLRVPGLFNVYNALAAVAVCRLLNVPVDNIRSSLGEFRGVPMRLELKELKGALVISDLYNANPASMEEAVKELVRLRRGRAVAVLGDMLELGSYGEQAHRKLGRWLATLDVDVLIAVGDLMSCTCEEFSGKNGSRQALHVKNQEEARKMLVSIVTKEDTILIKAWGD